MRNITHRGMTDYRKVRLKLILEEGIMLPFVWLGKLWGLAFPLKTKHNLFFFFSSADIGGAPRVNIDITQCLKDQKPIIFFSKKPKNNQFRREFDIDGVRVVDLHKYIDNKLFHFINFFFRGVLASWVNAREKPVLFGGECLYFYKVIPHVKEGAKCIELCHLPTWLGYSLGHIRHMDVRVFSTIALKKEVEHQYKMNHLPQDYFKRLYFIDNAIDIPPFEERHNEKMEVVYIGRGAPQKRVHLIAAIAEKLHQQNTRVHFTFVGDVETIVNPEEYPYCSFMGNVKDQQQMEAIYAASDVLLLTSAYEGLPIVVMKMMAYGKVVVSTAVNGIPDYVHHGENGLLVWEKEEPDIVAKSVEFLSLLVNDPDLRKRLGRKNRSIAKELFDREIFCKNYRQLFNVEC